MSNTLELQIAETQQEIEQIRKELNKANRKWSELIIQKYLNKED